MTPSWRATSARAAGAPVPSRTSPPRITRSSRSPSPLADESRLAPGLPRRGHADVGPVERGHRRAAEELERADDVAPEDLDRGAHARAPGGAEAVRVGAAHQHRARAHAERLDDVAPPANAAVEHDVDA